MTPLKIAIAGLGTVGVGLVKLLTDNNPEISKRAGREIEIVAISARDKSKYRGVDLSKFQWIDDPVKLADTDADVIVELMGGEGGSAYALVKTALEKGKTVVTANKALLAHHGVELAQIAEKTIAGLLFEAAVAGGIPAIKVLREGLSGNKIRKLYGILNGTCNYILTTMETSGRDFPDVLKEAQDLGYAEAEPSLDVDGGDTAHKLCLLSSLAFGIVPDLEKISTNGIRPITAEDIQAADELGYKIKLLGQAECINGQVVQLVEPCLVPKNNSLAHTSGVLNAVYVDSEPVGSTFIEGRGAGAGPTASAVMADLIDLARGNRIAPFNQPVAGLQSGATGQAAAKTGSYYIRLKVLDQPGVIAEIAAILRDYKISIESLIQRGRDPDQPVSIVLTTHDAKREDMNSAAAKIGKLSTIIGEPLVLSRLIL